MIKSRNRIRKEYSGNKLWNRCIICKLQQTLKSKFTNHEVGDESAGFQRMFSDDYFGRTMIEKVQRGRVLYAGWSVAGSLWLDALQPWGTTPKRRQSLSSRLQSVLDWGRVHVFFYLLVRSSTVRPARKKAKNVTLSGPTKFYGKIARFWQFIKLYLD